MVGVLNEYDQARRLHSFAPMRGVAVIIENPAGQILFVTERYSKEGIKEAGDHTCPMETAEGDESIEENIRRAIDEEATGIQFHFTKEQGIYHIKPGVTVVAFVLSTDSFYLPELSRQSDVYNPRWVGLDLARTIRPLRRGAREILEDYLYGRTRIVCLECEEPPSVPS